jgi:hypothetical protein
VIYDGNGTINVTADKPYKLVINGKEYSIPVGVSSYRTKP